MKTTLLIAAMLLAATVGHAEPLDPLAGISKPFEPKQDYDARMSGDPARIEAVRARKAQERAVPDDRFYYTIKRTTKWGTR